MSIVFLSCTLQEVWSSGKYHFLLELQLEAMVQRERRRCVVKLLSRTRERRRRRKRRYVCT